MSQATLEKFIEVLKEFVSSLSARYPSLSGLMMASQGLNMFAGTEESNITILHQWNHFAEPEYENIRNRNTAAIVKAFQNCENYMIASIGAGQILQDPALDIETREAIWDYLTTLSAMSKVLLIQYPDPSKTKEAQTPSMSMPPPLTPATVSPPVQASAPPPQQQARPQVPQANDIVSGISKAVPELMKAFNDIMKQDDGDNPMAQMFKQLMNPNAMQPGLAPNMAAAAMDRAPGSVMQEASARSGLTADDIMYRLQRLENLERIQAKRMGKRSERTSRSSKSKNDSN